MGIKESDFLLSVVDKENLINENTLKFKEKDYSKIIDILTIVCKSIEVIPEIVFEKIELLDDEFENDKHQRLITIENSRLIKLRIHFKLVDENGNIYLDEKTNKELRPTIDLLIPRLIDGSFIISDVTYYAMLQILDYKSLLKENKSIVKTIINKMEIEIKKNRKKQSRVELDVFTRKELPMWLVLLALYKPKEALERVFRTKDITFGTIVDKETRDLYIENKDTIVIGDKFIKINNFDDLLEKEKEHEFSISLMAEALQEFVLNKNIVKTVEQYAESVTLEEFLEDNEVFIELLGSYYCTNSNKYLAKGESVLHSFRRFLDDISKKYMKVNDLLEMFISELERINKHNIAIKTNDEETLENNMANNLLNKRMRMSEYIIYAFTKKLSDNMHVILNTINKDTIRINKILNIFKIDKNIIIKALLTNNLVRYNEQSNLMTAIGMTKASFVSTEVTKKIPDTLMAIPHTGLGRIDIITTPTGHTVGLTFNLSATNQNLIDDSGIII